MYIEKIIRKVIRFDLNAAADLEAYNQLLRNPSTRIIEKTILEQKESHFEQDYSTTETHHIAYLEVEECAF
jgi:hypothetical protein